MKILYFDYWTVGIHNFVRLESDLHDRGHETRLLHLGSWRDKNTPREEFIAGIDCRDISYFSNNIGLALRSEKPDVLLSLNYTHTMDRVIRRLCRKYGIKCVYMMHGARSTAPEAIEKLSEKLNRSIGISGRLRRIPAYVRTMFWYIRSLNTKGMTGGYLKTELSYLVQMWMKPGEATLLPQPHPDLWWDLALVYSTRYREFLEQQIGYPADQILIVGNPELDSVRQIHSQELASSPQEFFAELGVRLHFSEGYVLTWVDEAVVEMGLISEEERLAEIRSLAAGARTAGFDLIIKLHPSTDATFMKEQLRDTTHIHFLESRDNARIMYHSTAVFGRGSTLLHLPLALGKPMFELKQGNRRSKNYRAVLHMVDAEEVPDILVAPHESYFGDDRKSQITEFIENDIGPLTGSSTGRIADALTTLNEAGPNPLL